MLIVICVGQDLSKCTGTGFYTLENKTKPLVLKELKKLWDDLPWRQQGEFSPSNTLLLDDSPYKALRNPVRTALLPLFFFKIPLAATTYLMPACMSAA
jgi:hypothetical protein